jgi:hypothetical protein
LSGTVTIKAINKIKSKPSQRGNKCFHVTVSCSVKDENWIPPPTPEEIKKKILQEIKSVQGSSSKAQQPQTPRSAVVG